MALHFPVEALPQQPHPWRSGTNIVSKSNWATESSWVLTSRRGIWLWCSSQDVGNGGCGLGLKACTAQDHLAIPCALTTSSQPTKSLTEIGATRMRRQDGVCEGSDLRSALS